MARLARVPAAGGAAVVYDPFCGTAMELIETALASRAAGGGASGGGGLTLVGTDVDAAAIAVAEANLAKADLGVAHAFGVRDFRDALAADAPLPLAAGSVDAMITNPPLGRRVKVANLHALFADLFRLSARALRPGGGRLVVINPLRAEPPDAATRRRLRSRASAPSTWGCARAAWRCGRGPGKSKRGAFSLSSSLHTHHHQGSQRRHVHWVWFFLGLPKDCTQL